MKKHSWLLTILVALLPTFLTIIIISGIFQANITNFRPRIGHDQDGYWHWARSFSEYGFNVGYNGFDESVAPAEFNHYAENGPFYQMIYGGIGQIIGWRDALPIYINMALIAIALIIFIRVAKLENGQILHVGALVVLLFPLLLYLPSSMHESLNQAISILLASIFWHLYTKKKKQNTAQNLLFIAFIIFASLIRLSWAILFFPFFFMLLQGNIFKKTILALLFSAILSYAVMRVSSYLLPPAGNIIFELLRRSLTEGKHVFLEHLSKQLTPLLTKEKNQMDLVVTLQLLTLTGWNFYYLFAEFKKKMSSQGSSISETTSHLFTSLPLFNLYNLLTPLGMSLFFYLVNGYHRIFIPHILITALLLISRKKYIPVYAMLIVGLLGSAPFLKNYQSISANFQPNSQEFIETRAILEKHLIFDEENENAWCNTILIPTNLYHTYITMIPTGFGTPSIISPENLTNPLKSKFVLLDDTTLTRGAYIKYFPLDELNLELLDSLPLAELYYNPGSGCLLEE